MPHASIIAAALIYCAIASTAGAGETCRASWYERGHTTASGERFRPDGLTMALRSHAFGGLYRVTNLANGCSAS